MEKRRRLQTWSRGSTPELENERVEELPRRVIGIKPNTFLVKNEDLHHELADDQYEKDDGPERVGYSACPLFSSPGFRLMASKAGLTERLGLKYEYKGFTTAGDVLTEINDDHLASIYGPPTINGAESRYGLNGEIGDLCSETFESQIEEVGLRYRARAARKLVCTWTVCVIGPGDDPHTHSVPYGTAILLIPLNGYYPRKTLVGGTTVISNGKEVYKCHQARSGAAILGACEFKHSPETAKNRRVILECNLAFGKNENDVGELFLDLCEDTLGELYAQGYALLGSLPAGEMKEKVKSMLTKLRAAPGARLAFGAFADLAAA